MTAGLYAAAAANATADALPHMASHCLLCCCKNGGGSGAQPCGTFRLALWHTAWPCCGRGGEAQYFEIQFGKLLCFSVKSYSEGS